MRYEGAATGYERARCTPSLLPTHPSSPTRSCIFWERMRWVQTTRWALHFGPCMFVVRSKNGSAHTHTSYEATFRPVLGRNFLRRPPVRCAALLIQLSNEYSTYKTSQGQNQVKVFPKPYKLFPLRSETVGGECRENESTGYESTGYPAGREALRLNPLVDVQKCI